MKHFDIAVVGAGAAGLMAGIFAGTTLQERSSRCSVAVLDGASRIGAKILISGGGRCNVTHDVVEPDAFFGDSRNSVAKVLRTFDVAQTIQFFETLGVSLKREETGKLFPVTNRARTVLDALLRASEDSGTHLLSSTRVFSVSKTSTGFAMQTSQGEVTCSKLVIATGGMSVPKSGSDGVGYELVRSLGHHVTSTSPALVPLLLPADHWMTRLSGIAADVELLLTLVNGRILRREVGSLLFTHFGVSGPVVLDMSRHWNTARSAGKASLFANFRPGEDHSSVSEWLLEMQKARPHLTLQALLASLLPERLVSLLITESARLDPARRMKVLSRIERSRLSESLTRCELPAEEDRGFNFAEVTAGGVPLKELHLSTMSSRICAGLYLCGEILDVDGRIGGYNFQWAWATGRLAGVSVAKSVV